MSRSASGALGGTTPSEEELLEKKNARTLAEKRSFLVRMVSDPKCYNPKIVRHLNMTSYRKMSEDVARDRTLRQTIGGLKLARPKYLTSEVYNRPGSEGDAISMTNTSIEDDITVTLERTGLQTPM